MIVSDIGPRDADIMLVGEAPGEQEERQGIPFVGSSGKLLKHMLRHSGIDYSTCYVTNVSDERPPGNNFSVFYEQKSRKTPTQRLQSYWSLLQKKIEMVKPKVVIALGVEALRAITNERGIDNWRGTPIETFNTIVIPTYHPAAVLRSYERHIICEMDFSKALRISKDGLSTEYVSILISPSYEETLSWIQSAIQAKKRIAFDIETIEKDVRCLGLASRIGVEDSISSICIPFIKFSVSDMPLVDNNTIHLNAPSPDSSSYWPVDKEVEILNALGELFKSNQFVGQNSIAFDHPLLEESLALSIDNHVFDTMHAWHLLYPEFPKGLSFICSVLTDFKNYWTHKETTDDRSEWHYNSMDTVVTLIASEKIEKELRESGMWLFYKTHIHPLVFSLSKAQQIGVKVDLETRSAMAKEQEAKLTVIRDRISELAGYEINPASHNQVKRLLYEKLKFPTMYKKKTVTTDEEALRKLERRYPQEEILSKIIAFRKVSKLIGTYLKAGIDEDGRMRTSFDASGTKGARISSSKTLWNTGLDLQNIPTGKSRGVENIRHLFVAKDNFSLLKGDLVQAETLVVAYILLRIGDDTLYKLYQNPEFDIHKWMAAKIFGISESDVTSYQRNVGKLANHSGNYGAGPRVLMTKALKDGLAGIDYTMSQRILSIRNRAIPGLTAWWRNVENKLRATRTLTTCLGRRRMFFGRLDDTTYRDAYSYEPQSTVGDVCNILFRRMSKHSNHSMQPILQVHDEVVCEVDDILIDKYKEMMEKESIVPLRICEKVDDLIIPIEVTNGKNWRDCQ